MIYFTSDQHFGHVNIIKYTGRPFEWSEAGAIECAVHIRDEYNRVVSDDDLVFHLGDYSLLKSADREKFIPLISSLKGHKVLIPLCVKLVCDISSIFVSYFTFLNVTAFFSFFSKRGCGGKSFFFFLNHF